MRAYVLFAVLIISFNASADLTIFDVRKNLAMSDNEPVHRDLIINGGSESGLSVGMIVTVQRRLPLYDSYQNHSAGDLLLKVAKIKIIYVQKGLAVGRLHAEFTRDVNPVLEDNFIMIGDRLDLSSASQNDKKSDQAVEESSAPAAAVAAAPPPPSSASAAQIVVNSVNLSSSGSPAPQSATSPPPKVDVPVLR